MVTLAHDSAVSVPRVLSRGLLTALLRAWFRIEVRGAEHLATKGPVVFVGNHTSLIDATLMATLLPPGVLFATENGAVPSPKRRLGIGAPDVVIEKPFAARGLVSAIRAGKACALFAEGRPPATEVVIERHPGIAWVIDKAEAAIVPIHIEGLERSRWGRAKAGYPGWLAPKVRVSVGAPRRLTLDGEARGKARRALAALAVGDILEDQRRIALDRHGSIPEALADAAAAFGAGRPVLSDPTVPGMSLRTLALGGDALGRVLGRRFKADERIGVLLPTAAGVPVVLTALWRLGVVPAMMNPTLGTGPALACLRAAQARKVLTSKAMIREARLDPLITALVGDGIEVLYTEDMKAEVGTADKVFGALSATLGAARAGRPFASAGGVTREHAAVILFTSGTEGSPKGVVLSHGNLLGNVAQILARTDVDASDVVFSALPVFHSFGLTGGVLVPLIAGATVAFYPNPLRYKEIAERAYFHQPTVIFGTDTFLAGWGRRANPRDFASIRAAIAGAEPVKEATRVFWLERFGVRIFEGYGATETAPVIAMNTPFVGRNGTTGRLMPGLEHRLEAMPGIDGARLLVRGPNVMKGYLRAENPGVVEAPEGGWYDTGDAVEIDAAGFVTIKGRIKRFAKVGGEMVSLAAVEGLASRAWPDMPLAAIAVPDARKGNRVVLALAPHDEGGDTSSEPLRARARAEGIAEILLPARIVVLPKIPLLGSGKPDYPELTRIILAEEEAV